jgi:glycosyltransferase involved in cell wall biosynthesis
MSILLGHPTGNPNSHNAALAYLETGLLERFCVAWMPSKTTLRLMDQCGLLRPFVQRFSRRRFPPIEDAPKSQDRAGEFWRLILRASGLDSDRLSRQANEWLMRTMVRECRSPTVTAVHSYEDCSAEPFTEAKHLGKSCIYDLPSCYYPAWQRTIAELAERYSDWLRPDAFRSDTGNYLEQKAQEIKLADLILVASSFVENSVREFYPQKAIARIPYGVDLKFWSPGLVKTRSDQLRFIYAGQVSARKGVPLLVEAWTKARLNNAELVMIGSWQLAEKKRQLLPHGVTWCPPCSAQALRDQFRRSDIIVFPSFSDGFGLVLLEGMGCGLAAIASEASAGPEIITQHCGRIFPTGKLDAMIDLLEWFDRHRDEVSAMGRAARVRAERWTWSNYRLALTQAVSKFV